MSATRALDHYLAVSVACLRRCEEHWKRLRKWTREKHAARVKKMGWVSGNLGSKITYLPMLDRSRKDKTYNAVTKGTILKSILRTTFLSVSGRTWWWYDWTVYSTSLPRTGFSSRSRGIEVGSSVTGRVLVGGAGCWYLLRKVMLGLDRQLEKLRWSMKSEIGSNVWEISRGIQ